MTDTRTPEQRRRIMQSVGVKDTGPELTVRRAVHRLGYRYRLYDRKLPGRPDLVFPSRRKVVFVHGCFWHWHGCRKGMPPKSRKSYWLPKLKANRARDSANLASLKKLGWSSLVVWQCETKESKKLERKLKAFLRKTPKSRST